MAGCWDLLSQQFLFRNVKKKIVVAVVASGDADVDCTNSGVPKIYFAAANSVELVSPVACRLWVRPSVAQLLVGSGCVDTGAHTRHLVPRCASYHSPVHHIVAPATQNVT